MIWMRIFTRTGAFETPLLLSISLLLWCSASNDANRGDTSAVPLSEKSSISPSVRESALVVPSPSMTSPSSHSVPVLIPSPHLCTTGPEYSSPGGNLLPLDYLYFDLSQPIQCSGVITLWEYCHYVIGFNNIPSGVWPCVWRRTNDTGYSLIGLNNITIVPREGDDLRCGNYTPKPEELIRVEVGDIVGFYAPENGFFMAVSPTDPYFQLQRTGQGFTDFVNDSDLVISSPGRALLRAIIDTTAVLPSILPGQKLNPAVPFDLAPTATAIPPSREPPLILLSTVTAACLVMVVLVTVVILCLLICAIRKRRRSLDIPTAIAVPDESMEYNNLYSPRVAHEVILGGHRTVMSIKDNPAYAEVNQDARTALRRSIEHTYESLSSFAVNHVHRINRENNGH